MDIRVGIQNASRELSFESTEDAATLVESVNAALASNAPSVTFSDDKGRTFVVPTATLAYVEVGTEENRRIGFVS